MDFSWYAPLLFHAKSGKLSLLELVGCSLYFGSLEQKELQQHHQHHPGIFSSEDCLEL